MASFVQRMVGAAKLDPAAYEEVEHDAGATGQAALVVVMAAVASGIGASGHGNDAVLGAVVVALMKWVAWCLITYAIGTGVFRGTATPGELLRTVGFAQAPGILLVLGGFPLLGGLIRFAVEIWVLVAVIIAIRQALDVDTTKAVLTALIGLAVVIGIFVTLIAVVGTTIAAFVWLF